MRRRNDHIEDFISDEEGPFSPERSGGLPMFNVIKMCFDGKETYHILLLFRKAAYF